MIGRMLAIARASIIEALRAKLTPLIALVLVLAVPLIATLFGTDPDTRAWLTRSITTEGLRIVLPLAAIVGGGFLLKPAIKSGWTVLPTRRTEYFIGTVLAGSFILMASATLFALGGWLANTSMDDDLTVTLHSPAVSKQRTKDGERQIAKGRPGSSTWANPRYGEELVFEIPEGADNRLQGTIEYELLWTAEGAPTDRSPVEVWLQAGADRTLLNTTVQSRYRVRFEGDFAGHGSLILQPTDPVLIVGSSPERVRIDVARTGSLGSVIVLLALSVCAALLCLSLVMFVRSLSTAPTAVLAGMLLLAALTLLPSLAPASKMAQDRRAAQTQSLQDSSFVQRFEAQVTGLPQLLPDSYFDEFLAARVVGNDAWFPAGERLLAALLFLPFGALLFRVRQLAK